MKIHQVLFFCFLSVLCVVSSHVQRQYHFVYERKNMTEAQSYCRDKYTDLATIDDMEDVKTLTDMADLHCWPLAWIGLYDDMNSWRWSHRDAEVEFTKWATGQPNNHRSGQHCTMMLNTGEWNDASCDAPLQAVCSYLRGSNVTFILINTNMSWTEAQSYCRANYTDLVTVRNEAENQEVKDLADGQLVWIGLFRDSWKWSDGSNSSFRYWATGEPNNNGKEGCVVINFHREGWEDWNCNYNKPFICYEALTTEEPTSVPSASTPATTQSLTSSSGSFTPSSSVPETTEQFADSDVHCPAYFWLLVVCVLVIVVLVAVVLLLLYKLKTSRILNLNSRGTSDSRDKEFCVSFMKRFVNRPPVSTCEDNVYLYPDQPYSSLTETADM